MLAGQPVEFLSRGSSDEGGDVLTLYRFAGAGPVIRYISEAGAWVRYACGIAPVESDLVFVADGDCLHTELTR